MIGIEFYDAPPHSLPILLSLYFYQLHFSATSYLLTYDFLKTMWVYSNQIICCFTQRKQKHCFAKCKPLSKVIPSSVGKLSKNDVIMHDLHFSISKKIYPSLFQNFVRPHCLINFKHSDHDIFENLNKKTVVQI